MRYRLSRRWRLCEIVAACWTKSPVKLKPCNMNQYQASQVRSAQRVPCIQTLRIPYRVPAHCSLEDWCPRVPGVCRTAGVSALGRVRCMDRFFLARSIQHQIFSNNLLENWVLLISAVNTTSRYQLIPNLPPSGVIARCQGRRYDWRIV